MDKKTQRQMPAAQRVRRSQRTRLVVQAAWTALTNGYVQGFAKGRIFTGPTKAVCVPGLNCYSCPGAIGACPIGALQAVLGSNQYKLSLYVLGFLFAVGALGGRFICGWLCPFGLVQDLLHKIPLPFRKRKNLPGHRVLRYLKYTILAVFVFLLPMVLLDSVGQGSPWFCKLICPSGTLTAGIPLVLANESLRGAIGGLFGWKIFLLAAIVLLSIWVYRPFCQYLCPLGAMYSFFNPIALYRYRVNKDTCTRCGACKAVCPVNITVFERPNSTECIRCGRCKAACPTGALADTFHLALRGKKDAEAAPEKTQQ